MVVSARIGAPIHRRLLKRTRACHAFVPSPVSFWLS